MRGRDWISKYRVIENAEVQTRLIFFLKWQLSWIWWLMPVILHTLEANSGGLPWHWGNAALPSEFQGTKVWNSVHKQNKTHKKFPMWWFICIIIVIRLKLSWRPSWPTDWDYFKNWGGVREEERSCRWRDRSHMPHYPFTWQCSVFWSVTDRPSHCHYLLLGSGHAREWLSGLSPFLLQPPAAVSLFCVVDLFMELLVYLLV